MSGRSVCTAFGLIAALAVGMMVGERLEWRSRPDNFIAVADTIRIVRTDTVRIETPIYKNRWRTRIDTCLLATVEHDTVRVEVPISATLYEDSLYKAQISGYKASLDWVEVYPKTVVETRTATIERPPRRWSVGAQAGIGMTPKGVQPYVGIGVGYRIY